jgi:hypothetical protein
VAIAGRDDSVREGTVSISHAFEDSNPARLVATDEVYDAYSGQPRMSNIPVSIRPH